MESELIWIITVIIAALILLPYAIKFRKTAHKDKLRKEEAQRLGADKPVAQFPRLIN